MQGSCAGGEGKTGGGAASKWSIIPAKATVPATGKGTAAFTGRSGGWQGVGQRIRKGPEEGWQQLCGPLQDPLSPAQSSRVVVRRVLLLTLTQGRHRGRAP